ncbi:hypothetical protein EC968_006555 [Mortierella alpina]|nr:hypothetical protein EC968_006555 [Mortierella alpina]
MDPHHTQWQHHHSYNDRSRKEPEPHYPHEPSDPQDRHYQQHQHQSQQQQIASYHTQQHSHTDGHSYPRGDHYYGRRGHRYSTDSAAADTLLMLSAAAFMDPAAARSVMAADSDRRIGGPPFSSVAAHEDHYSGYLGRSQGPSHYSSRYSPPPPEPRPLAMAKTVSAPASSSSAGLHSLPPFSRLHHHQHQQHLDHVREMDIDPTTPPPALSSTSSSTRFKSESSQRLGSRYMDSEDGTPRPTHFVCKASSPPAVFPAKSEPSSSSMQVDAEGFEGQHSLGSQPSKDGAPKVKHEKEDLEEEEEEEEEDEVMSEGVVHVNSRLAPIALSPQTKRRSSSSFSHPLPPLPPSISTSAANQQQDPPKTPTSARTPRTPKQTKAPKLPRTPRTAKRSQGDYQASSGSRGKNGTKDSLGDYFFSPFPPSSSPASSPSSPSSFHAQLQMLTCNFVSVQPHASPTGRFRRVPSSIVTSTATPPVSPPASPGLDLLRDSPFHAGLRSATTSPTKAFGSGSASVPPSPGFARSGPVTPQRSHFKPRWHTQPYMMFLALRAMPDRTAARQELIMAAVELDKKFSAEKGLPRVFTGKTPMNSASACLTNNGDKYFIPFKPEGSRSTHFRLAYQPVDFQTAVNEYNGWMDRLVQHDWPLCFGIPREGATATSMHDDGQDIGSTKRAISPPESKKRSADHGEAGLERDFTSGGSNSSSNSNHNNSSSNNNSNSSKKIKAENESLQLDLQASTLTSHSSSREDTRVADKMQRLDIQASNSVSGSPSCPSTPTRTTTTTTSRTPTTTAMTSPLFQEEVARNHRKVGYRLEDLDTRHVPTRLSDIVRVGVSTVPNAGNGVFAVVDLPVGTPLGFYFGVPMTENEFDSLKDGVGMASQYSIMYHRTVLDATDASGQPYTDPQGVLYCPFHFMNDDPDGNVSFIAGSTVNQVICTTNRDVKAGEELLVFYGKEMMDRPWAVATAATAQASGGQEGQQPSVGEGGESRKSRAGSRSRANSPVRKATSSMTASTPTATATTTTATTTTTTTMMEEGGRPRRETVYKPARYTR